MEVGCIYPLMHQQGFYDGMRSVGEEDVVTLSRSAWAGSQRFGPRFGRVILLRLLRSCAPRWLPV
jgi:alpha-glucosidase (family GH31 glycosyl hydrolase)